MNPIIIDFADFISAENYYHLIHRFLSKDINYKFTFFEDLKFSPGDINIDVYKDPVTARFNPEKAEIQIIDFEQEFLLENIPKMADYYFEILTQEARKANQNTPESLEYFFMPILEALNQYTLFYSQADFLKDEIRKLLIEEANELIGLCRAHLSNPYPLVQKKLKFRLKRIDVEAFFFLLREKKIIANISDTDLGVIIENMCEFQKKEGTNEFFLIRDSGKKITGIHNGERFIDKSLKRLSKLFDTKFFTYNLGSK